jgi:glyoxylase-like metal-dependent hydrolase (beta-lactamase superfamily II)
MPKVQEFAVFHRASRTLIVGDLLFNFPENATWWTKFAARWLLRLDRLVGMSLVFRSMIQDKPAFRRSLDEIFAWDFDRVIVGHGEVVERGGKQLLRRVVDKVV